MAVAGSRNSGCTGSSTCLRRNNPIMRYGRPASEGTPTDRPLFLDASAPYTEIMPSTSYRYLVNVPNLCGGMTIVEGTRVGVHDVVGLIVNGATVDEVLRSFPNLTRAQVYECLAYYEDHRAAINASIAQQMTEELR